MRIGLPAEVERRYGQGMLIQQAQGYGYSTADGMEDPDSEL